MEKKAVAILVGGGPAPAINGVISAVTIEAINRGHNVLGVHSGFKLLSKGDDSCLENLSIDSVSRIPREGGSVLGTSRANPTKDPNMLKNVVEALERHNVGYLVTIGGDDTANSARAVNRAANGRILVGHVPKTIDNDLPLHGNDSTFGFQTACEAGTHIVQTLQTDAKTTGRWYLVVAMGRKAGHLALGIGVSAGATLTIIPEDFDNKTIHVSEIADRIVGMIIKRLAMNRAFGVVVLAEGLAEILDPNSVPELSTAERDPHGHIRFAEVDIGHIIKNAVKDRLAQLGLTYVTIVDKNVGYELRCGSPIAFDRIYTQQLGYGIIDFLLAGGNGAMMSRRDGALVPIPFDDLIDPQTGKTRIRMVSKDSATYQVARKYMIRLTKKDLADRDLVEKMASVAMLSPEKLVEMFDSIADPEFGYC